MRRVWTTAFALYTAPVPLNQLDQANINTILGIQNPGNSGSAKRFGVPQHLRWLSRPIIGFPRAPFEVFRRPHVGKTAVRLRSSAVEAFGSATIEWPGEMIEVQFRATPQAGTSLTIDALDAAKREIPGQRIRFSSQGTGSFLSQGIRGIKISGFGTVDDIRGTEQNDFANRPEWTRIQLVGFPYHPNEVNTEIYDTSVPQGLEGAFTDGNTAGRQRLTINSLLTPIPPDNNIADFPTPVWPAIDPTLFMTQLRDLDPSLLGLITNCLANSDDSDPSNLQADHTESILIDGFQAPGSSGPPGDSVNTEFRITQLAMMAVSTDGDSSAGLGYGTSDFPPRVRSGTDPHRRPPGIVRPVFDYMVVAKYTFPFLESLELAALGVPRPPPGQAENLMAEKFLTNLPAALDEPEMEAVQLTFDPLPLPQGFAIAKSIQPGQAEVLNTKRQLSSGFDPFVPLTPEPVAGDPPVDSESRFVDIASPVPLSGSETRRYIVAGLDVFNRFSDWALASHVSSPDAVQKPGLDAVSLTADPDSAVGHVLAGRISFEFSWNWADRSLDRVLFRSRFFPFNQDIPPSSSSGFAKNSDMAVPPGDELVVRFDSAGAPSIDLPHVGQVETVVMNPPAEESRRYRVTVDDMSLDFSTNKTLAVAVLARAAERVRPTQLSGQVGPRTANISDPLPADNPTLPVDILWTALADATRTARAHLSWSATPGATGYFLWQATETALRTKLVPNGGGLEETATLVERATSLRDLLLLPGAYERSLGQFSRLNERKHPQTNVELELPGDAESLYVYRISTITATGVESARSTSFVLAAVPKQNIPAAPRLVARPHRDTPAGINVTAIARPGPSPAGYKVYRLTGNPAVADVGRMGPAVLTAESSGWIQTVEPVTPGGVTEAALAIRDLIEASWHPRTYRIVAIGSEDLANGQIAGESEPSNAQTVVLPPQDGPLVMQGELLTSTAAITTHRVLNIRTNLPAQRTPLGVATLRVDSSAIVDQAIRRSMVFAADTTELTRGDPYDPNDTLADEDLLQLPQARRSTFDSDGFMLVSIRLPISFQEGTIVVTDPLQRSANLFVSVSPP
jgi:hypothetical protein